MTGIVEIVLYLFIGSNAAVGLGGYVMLRGRK